MAVKKKEEILEQIKNLLGENDSDDAIQLIEDVSDTIGEPKDETDWKAKYEENDKEWRTRYRDRFYGKVDDKDELEKEIEKEKEEENEITNFDDLFKEE